MRLDALLRPRSIAILGASERPSVGRTLIEALDRLGFPGPLYPINPKYDTLLVSAVVLGVLVSAFLRRRPANAT